MDFEFNMEQMAIQQMARDFARDYIQPVAQEVDRTGRVPLELVPKLSELGFFGMTIPEEYGGEGLGNVEFCLVQEEISRYGTAGGFFVANNMFALPLIVFGTDEQKQKYLPRLASGEILAATAATEPDHGSDLTSIDCEGRFNGDHWVLKGNKMFCTQPGKADVILTIVQTNKELRHKGIVAFVIEPTFPGFSDNTIEGEVGGHGLRLTELIYDDMIVPSENMVGKVGEGFKVMTTCLDRGRLSIAAACVGICQGAIDACISYVKQRKQFGKEIGKFQMIQGRLADMIVETEAARSLTYRAASLVDAGKRNRMETAYAKFFCSEVAQRVTWNAIQIHGGYGLIDEYPVQRLWRDCREFTIVDGTSDIQRLVIARDATGLNAFV